MRPTGTFAPLKGSLVIRFRLVSFVALVAALLALTAGIGGPGPALAEEVQFYVGSSISAEDAMYVREGIRLGQDYVRERLGAELGQKTIVNAVPAAPRAGATVVGVSTSHAVVVYTGSEGWRRSAPFDRVHVVVHEYMHVVQEDLASDRGSSTPLWIDEGIAEYVGYQAVIEAGLISAEDVERFNAANVVFGPSLPPLAEVESRRAYQAQPANIYGLSYLAVQQLVGDRPESISRYYEKIGAGASWRAAFQSAFRINPTDFYEAFETYRPRIQAPFNVPTPFAPADEYEYPAAVFLDSAPESIERGEQLLIIAGSDAGVRCSLTVSTRAGTELLNQPTFADPTGLLFWLWTVPADSRRAAVTAAISCGADPVTTRLTIT
jgi:hypothetical protein